jgi:molybdopterin synthase sulfur carrier subunit
MKISVRYFARVRELLGPGQDVEWPEGSAEAPSTVGQLRLWLAAQSALHHDALAPSQGLRAACNQTMCQAEHALTDGAEVAFFPPVTGG